MRLNQDLNDAFNEKHVKLKGEVKMRDFPLVKKVTKEFDIKAGITIPSKIAEYKSGTSYLFIAPEKASFITTNETGKKFLYFFKNGDTIEEVIEKMKRENMEMNTIISQLHSFLVKVERKSFYEDAEVKEVNIDEPVLHLDITNKCNLRCSHCFQDAGEPRENELTSDEWLKIIDAFSSHYRTSVTVSGGEPLLHPGIFDLLKRAKNNGLQISLFSNGTLINNEKIVDELQKWVDKIQLSLDGAIAETNDAIRGAGSFENVITAFQLLKDTNISLDLALSLLPQNVQELKKDIEKLTQRISDKVNFRISPVMREGRANKSHDFPNKRIAQLELREVLSNLYRKRLRTISKFEKNVKLNNCGFGETVVVSSVGDVYPCNVYEPKTRCGNVRENDFAQIFEKIRRYREDANVENIKTCAACDLKIVCFGGCRLNNIYRNNDILQPACTEETRKELCAFIVDKEENFDPLSLLMEGSGV